MALYQPTNIVPDVRSGIGEGTVDVTQGMKVTWQINGASALSAFSIAIMSNNASSTQLYTTGKITDGCPAYGTSSNGTPVPFSYTIPATALSTAGITNGNEYKLLITQWWSDNDSITQSSASVFITRNEPTLAITPIVTQAEITDLQTSIVPIQSGTGDPYPAGGGVNKYPILIGADDFGNNGGATHTNDNGALKIVTNAGSGASGCYLYPEADIKAVFNAISVPFTVSMTISATTTATVRWTVCGVGNSYTQSVGTTPTRLERTVTDKSTINFNIYGVNSGATLTCSDLQIEAGSTASPYAPYSNIRPISGWTGANIWDDPVYGGNIYWNQKIVNGDFSDGVNGWIYENINRISLSASDNTLAVTLLSTPQYFYNMGFKMTPAISFEAGHKYLVGLSVKAPHATASFIWRSPAVLGGSGQIGVISNAVASEWKRGYYIFTAANTTTAQPYVCPNAVGDYVENDVIYYKDYVLYDLTAMFGAGNEPTIAEFQELFPSDFYAYNAGETTCVSAVNGNPYGHYTATWSDEAGTVYGGTIDVTLGKLIVTMAGETFANLKTKTTYPSGAYFNILKSAIGAKETTSAVWGCSCFTKTAGSANYSIWETASAIRFKDTDYANVNELVAALGSEMIVYELATPLEYDLTPTEIQLLLKKNNIWSDTGAVDATVELVGHSTEYTGDIIEVFGGDTAIFTRYYTFTADYEQSQGDVLNYYRWLIANADNTDNPFYDSGYISGTMDLSCFYDGFLPQEDYAVKLMIQTENGVDATAGWDYFGCDYSPSSTSGVLNAKCVGGTDAIAVSWEGIGYIPGIGAGDYSISDDNILSLPSGASATWRLMGTAPMSLAAPWSVIWKGTLLGDATIFTIGQEDDNIVLSYSEATGTLTLTKGGTTLASQTGAINSPTVTAILTATTLYLRVYYIGGGLYPSASLYPATTLYPIADNTPVTNTYTKSITYTQGAITSVTLGAIQECNYIEVVNGAVSADVITAAITNGTYYPEVSESDYMMANFTQGLNAGTVDVGGDYLVGYALYRQRGNDGRLIKIADTDVATSKVYDYGATTGQGPYTYYLFPVGTNTYIAAALVSPSVVPCWWNWTLMECAETDNENIYDVVAAYRFRLNIESGAVTNNNAPSVFANFTRYPTIQLAPQNYKAGTLTGLIGAVYWTDGQPKYRDTIQLQNAIYALSTTHNALFLKNRKGELLRVRISGAISMQTGDNTREQALTMTLPWVEIGSAENVSLCSLDYAGVQEEEKDCTTPLYEGAC